MVDISVVVPVYNKNYSVEKCLNSIFSQTILPREVVIVDDGSTDNSIYIIKNFLKNKNTLKCKVKILEQKNQGVSVARNIGIKNSSGNYIALLDADDIWHPLFISEMLELISIYPNQPLYTCKHKIYDEKIGKFIPIQQFGCTKRFGLIDNYHRRALSGDIVNSSKVVLNKRFIEDCGGFPEGETLCEDLYVWSVLSLLGKVAFVDYVGATINQFHDESRIGRIDSLPYIISYYSKHLDYVDCDLKEYLWVIYKNHLRLAILECNRDTFISRWKQGKKIFSKRANILLLYIIVPSFLLNKIKTLHRIYLKLRYNMKNNFSS